MSFSLYPTLIKSECQEYILQQDQPCASEEHANLPVGLCVRDIKQKLKVVVVTKGQLGQKFIFNLLESFRIVEN